LKTNGQNFPPREIVPFLPYIIPLHFTWKLQSEKLLWVYISGYRINRDPSSWRFKRSRYSIFKDMNTSLLIPKSARQIMQYQYFTCRILQPRFLIPRLQHEEIYSLYAKWDVIFYSVSVSSYKLLVRWMDYGLVFFRLYVISFVRACFGSVISLKILVFCNFFLVLFKYLQNCYTSLLFKASEIVI